MVTQRRSRRRCQRRYAVARAAGELREIMLRERNDILTSGPQRRYLQLVDIQTVVQIGPETSFRHQGRQIRVARRHDTSLGREFLGAAESAIAAIFKQSEELALQRLRQRRDLVEEQGAPVGLFHQARHVPCANR